MTAPGRELPVKRRYSLLDALRGLTVASMVGYHFCYDWFIICGADPQWWRLAPVRVWQQSICWTFILLAGVCFHLGRRRWRSGVIISIWGAVVTAVTVLAEPSQAIWYGVLTLHGASILLVCALKPLLEKIPTGAGGAVSFLLFALTYPVQRGALGLPGLELRLPGSWYQTGWLTFLGFPGPGFASSDYFPLLPWFFLYLTGYFLGRVLLERPAEALYRKVPGLDWVGRHSLLVYLLHQPVCLGVALLAARVLG